MHLWNSKNTAINLKKKDQQVSPNSRLPEGFWVCGSVYINHNVLYHVINQDLDGLAARAAWRRTSRQKTNNLIIAQTSGWPATFQQKKGSQIFARCPYNPLRAPSCPSWRPREPFTLRLSFIYNTDSLHFAGESSLTWWLHI